jgi:spermidine/putrescine transport system ATP-binding protein
MYAGMDERIIELKGISKAFDGTEALRDINLAIRQNEFVTLLGPSGCGKTTMLRVIGGFEQPTAGDVFFRGTRINDLPPYKRRLNTVFQSYALFPHMDVEENISFGLHIKRIGKDLIKQKVSRMLELINLPGFENRRVTSLSGGQQQRVAIARALVNEPEVLLLDEPLGALDLKLRKEMQLELKNIQKKLSITFVYVTHDQEEALTMSDTVVVMRGGVVQQIGTPEDVYNEPKNSFVARFIGESNIVEGIMLKDCEVSFAGKVFPCVDHGFAPDEAVEVVIRPEDVHLMNEEEGMISARIVSAIFKGVHYEMAALGNGVSWIIHSTQVRPVGTAVGLSIRPDDIHVMRKDAQN